jgi:hypothetical protein
LPAVWLVCLIRIAYPCIEQNAPAWVWFVGEDGVHSELPKTASGKVMKHVLRGMSKELSEKGIGRASSSEKGNSMERN